LIEGGQMLVLSKRNIIIPAPDGSTAVRRAGLMEIVPDWAVKTPYFQALVADGKIVPSGRSDKEAQAASEKKVKTRRGNAVTEE
jgi:hypothetical protein